MKVQILGTGFLGSAIREVIRGHHTETTVDPDVVWVAYDALEESDTDWHQFAGPLLVIATPVPVGTCAQYKRAASVPENVRRKTAVDDFRNMGAVIAGVRNDRDRAVVQELYEPFCDEIIFMSPESSELTKHARNAFFAASIDFINDIRKIAEKVGADIYDVSVGMKADRRIGHGAYLGPDGEPGPYLTRDVKALERLR